MARVITEQQMMAMPLIPVSVLYETWNDLLPCDGIVDDAANLFVAARHLGRNNNTRVIVSKYAPDGALIDEWAVDFGYGWKGDSVSLAASGSDLLVIDTAHQLGTPPGAGRLSPLAVGRIPGVFVRLGNQTPKAGAAGAYVPAQSEPGGTEVDYNKVQQIVKDEIQRFIDLFGDRGNIRLALQNKAGDALLFMNDPEKRGEEKVQKYQDIDFAQKINTSWSANMVSAYLLGQWDGKLPDGSIWRHPLTGKLITEERPWVTKEVTE